MTSTSIKLSPAGMEVEYDANSGDVVTFQCQGTKVKVRMAYFKRQRSPTGGDFAVYEKFAPLLQTASKLAKENAPPAARRFFIPIGDAPYVAVKQFVEMVMTSVGLASDAETKTEAEAKIKKDLERIWRPMFLEMARTQWDEKNRDQ